MGLNPAQVHDAHTIINLVAEQAIGKTALANLDTSNFASVAETVLKCGNETVLNAISAVLARTIFAVRPYTSKFWSMEVDADAYGAVVRKLNFLHSGVEESEAYNLLNDAGNTIENLADGQSVDQYKIHKPGVLQTNFYGQQAMSKTITRFLNQLNGAFRSEGDFMEFVAAYMTEFLNEIEVANEAKKRATALNYIAGISSMGLTEVDLAAGYNTLNGTTYTRAQLLGEHFADFVKYAVAEIQVWSDRLEDYTSGFHANITGKEVLRHTEKRYQKILAYNPFFSRARTMVYSNIKWPEYLSIGAFEGVNYWQAQDKPEQINLTPNILDVSTGASKKAETAVEIPYVVALLYDKDGLGVNNQYQASVTTPLNAKGLYYNTIHHWLFRPYNDFTENAVLFVVGEGS